MNRRRGRGGVGFRFLFAGLSALAAAVGCSRQTPDLPPSPRNRVLVPFLKSGQGELTLDNGTPSSAIVKLISDSAGRKECSAFIDSNSRFKVSGIPDGRYRLIFCLGGGPLIHVDQFENPEYSAAFDRRPDFTTTVTRTETQNGIDVRTRTSVFGVTLHAVASGNARTSRIPVEEFNGY